MCSKPSIGCGFDPGGRGSRAAGTLTQPPRSDNAHGLGLDPPPEARADSDDLAENTAEMGLVGHSAVKSDLRKRLSSAQHDDLGVTYPPYFGIDEGRLTETLFECAREMANAEL